MAKIVVRPGCDLDAFLLGRRPIPAVACGSAEERACSSDGYRHTAETASGSVLTVQIARDRDGQVVEMALPIPLMGGFE